MPTIRKVREGIGTSDAQPFRALPLFAASPAQPRFFGAKSHADDEQTGD